MELPVDVFLNILYALGIGVLVGLERSIKPPKSKCEGESSAQEREEEVNTFSDTFLGVRTFSILSLGGFLTALVGSEYPFVAPIIMAGLIFFIAAMYMVSYKEDPGITTEIAAVVCCGLGMLCYIDPYAAGTIALIVTTLLSLKRFMNSAVTKLKRVELVDTLKFLAIILIILPLLPNREIDPWSVINPYKIMFLIILISGISFIGYFLTKFLGTEKGLGLTGLVGGLTSSTAVTAAMATQAKQYPAHFNAFAFATIIANATMFGRVLVVVAILDWPLVIPLFWSIGAMTIAAGGAVFVLWIKSVKGREGDDGDASEAIQLSNPFSLGPAIKFALFFVGILFVAKFANMYLGDKGIYLASLVSGLADVDAITLSITEQTKAGQLSHTVGAMGVTIAVVSNSVVKSCIAVYSGGWRFGAIVGSILLGATGLGLCVLLLM
ncbi:MgtC/SapB family protein [Desulforhopalus sp. 52FAK]